MHTCDICNKRFVYQSGLSRHKNVHEADSKVKCICGDVCSRRDVLKRHQLKCNMLDSKLVDPTVSSEEISDSETSIDNSHMDDRPKKQRKRKQSSSGVPKVAKRRKPKYIDAKQEAPQLMTIGMPTLMQSPRQFPITAFCSNRQCRPKLDHILRPLYTSVSDEDDEE